MSMLNAIEIYLTSIALTVATLGNSPAQCFCNLNALFTVYFRAAVRLKFLIAINRAIKKINRD